MAVDNHYYKIPQRFIAKWISERLRHLGFLAAPHFNIPFIMNLPAASMNILNFLIPFISPHLNSHRGNHVFASSQAGAGQGESARYNKQALFLYNCPTGRLCACRELIDEQTKKQTPYIDILSR